MLVIFHQTTFKEEITERNVTWQYLSCCLTWCGIYRPLKTEMRWMYAALKDIVVEIFVPFHRVRHTWIRNQSWVEVWEFPVPWHYDGISAHMMLFLYLTDWFSVFSGVFFYCVLDTIRVRFRFPFRTRQWHSVDLIPPPRSNTPLEINWIKPLS